MAGGKGDIEEIGGMEGLSGSTGGFQMRVVTGHSDVLSFSSFNSPRQLGYIAGDPTGVLR